MRVLITGHRGYVGAHAVDVFKEAGHHVTGVDIALYRGTEFARGRPPDVDVTIDIFDLDRGLFNGVDAVVHLAALSNDPLGDIDPRLTRTVNTDGTRYVADCAKRAGVGRFLLASSCSIYGAADCAAQDEDAPVAPITTYALSKVEAESALRRLASRNFAVVCLRCATAYGESPNLRTDLVVNNLLAHATSTGEVKLLSDGLARRPLIHCRDMARSFLGFAETASLTGFQAVNVGSNGENYRVRQVAEIVRREVPNSTITIDRGAVSDRRDYRVSFDRLGKCLPAFQCQHRVQPTVRRMHREFRANPTFRRDFEAGRFTRLVELQRRIAERTLPEYFLGGARDDGASGRGTSR